METWRQLGTGAAVSALGGCAGRRGKGLLCSRTVGRLRSGLAGRRLLPQIVYRILALRIPTFQGLCPDADFTTSAGPEANREARLGGAGARVSAEIEKRTGKETRNCVLGHLQRGGSPTTFDRVLCSMFGATAVELVAAGDFGKMVAFTGGQVAAVKISDAVGRLKTVPPDGNLARTARALGISLGD